MDVLRGQLTAGVAVFGTLWCAMLMAGLGKDAAAGEMSGLLANQLHSLSTSLTIGKVLERYFKAIFVALLYSYIGGM